MLSVTLNRLAEIVTGRYTPLVDNIIQLLSSDTAKSYKYFEDEINRSLRNYEDSFPLVKLQNITLSNTDNLSESYLASYTYWYQFDDNFASYIAGSISERNIELIPEAFFAVNLDEFHALTSNWWNYRKPIIYASFHNVNVRYATKYPTSVTYAADGSFSLDSAVYYIDEFNEPFLRRLAFQLLTRIKAVKNSVELPTMIQFLNFDQILAELKEEIDHDVFNAPNIFESWRIR